MWFQHVPINFSFLQNLGLRSGKTRFACERIGHTPYLSQHLHGSIDGARRTAIVDDHVNFSAANVLGPVDQVLLVNYKLSTGVTVRIPHKIFHKKYFETTPDIQKEKEQDER